MVNQRNRYPGRRRFLKQSAALSARAAIPAAVVLAGAAAAKAQPQTEEAKRAEGDSADRARRVAHNNDPTGNNK